MDEPKTIVILPAEYIGEAKIDRKGFLSIGKLKLHLGVWWKPHNTVSVYVRRKSSDLSIIEIHMAHHDKYAVEALDEQNFQASIYTLGPREYWHSKYVDNGGWSEEQFEDFWNDEEDNSCDCDHCTNEDFWDDGEDEEED